MFDKLNPFARKPKNPLDQLGEDELRTTRVKLEKSRERTLDQIRELEERKALLFDEGVQSDSRVRLDRARRIKEAEEQIHHLDQQLAFFGKQIQIVTRFVFLKQNRAQMIESGIDQVLSKMDTGELRSFVDELSINGAVNSERLDELSKMLETALGSGFGGEQDPEIARLLEEMERASSRPLPEMPFMSDEAPRRESRDQEPPLSV